MSDQTPEHPPGQPPYGQPPGGQSPYGQPPPGAPYGQPQEAPYGQPYGQAYGQPATTGTNGMAIASLVCAFFCTPLGLIFGFIALSQIKERGQGGRGLAIAGIVISIVSLVIGIAIVAGSS